MEQRQFLYVKLKGLPFDVEMKDVLKFLGGIQGLTEQDCAFRYRRGGKFSGLAFVRLSNQEDLKKALEYHKKYIDQRYVEVFTSSETEWKSAMHTGKDSTQESVMYTDCANESNGFVKARGLPFDSTLEQIAEFFAGFEIMHGGVWRSYYRDRPDGQCFVVFKDEATAMAAVEKLNQKHLGKRYLELFVITLKDFQNFLFKNKHNLINDVKVEFDEKFEPMQPRRRYGGGGRRDNNRGGNDRYGGGERRRRNDYGGQRRDRRDRGDYNDNGYGDRRDQRDHRGSRDRRRGGGGGGGRRRGGYSPSKNDRTLLGKGFPYDVNKDDVKDFFGQEYIEDIEYVYFINSGGRFTGDCYIVFSDEKTANNARKAKHKQYIGKRYINLFSNAGESDDDDY